MNAPGSASEARSHDEQQQQQQVQQKVPSRAFYQTYHGHEVGYLQRVRDGLRTQGKKSLLWLAGDSTMDNKYWFNSTANACNGYENILDAPHGTPMSKMDVTYHLNQQLAAGGVVDTAAINTAVEATTLGQRVSWMGTYLTEQDEFIRDNISQDDTLVVSVGGNDIAMAPTPATIANMLWLIKVSRRDNITAGTAGGMAHFINIFGERTRQYIEALTEKTKPKKVVVCMLYFLDQAGEGSWADAALSCLNYNTDPSLLQLLIQQMYERATSQIRIDGTEVVPCPLYTALDGTNTHDYAQRVEPSHTGGGKLAKVILAHAGLV